LDPNDDPEKTVARPVGADLFQQAPLVALGALIANRYRVISKLGAGGMSEVFKCEDLVLKREVAVKLLLPHFKSNEKALKRLHLEAQAAARLDHDHIVKVFEYQISDSGAPFIVMDYIQGKSLDQLISDNGWLEPARVLELSDQICSALQHAHEKNIVHRDLKPSNIMVADRDGKEQVKIVDFGIAKVYEASDQQASLTQTGELVGSPLYMSPEQCLGAAIDARSDQYSLACLLFHALAGAPPFSGNNPIETLMKHTTEVAPSLSQASLGKTFPKQIEESLAKALSKEPSQRYLDIQSFRDAFFGKTNPSRSQVSAVAKPALSVLKYVLPTLLLVGTAAFSSWYFAPPHTRKMDQRQLTPPSTAPISSDGAEDYNTNPFFQRQASEERNVLIFQFPPTKYLGELNDHRAQGLCILPYSDRNELRFVAAPNCVAELRRFRPDDLKILTLHSAEEGFLVDKTPGPPVSEQLKNISHMTGLENLVVSHCHLSARDLKRLNPLVSLRRLNLSGNSSIDGQDLAQCAWLSQLTYLDFCSCGEGIDSLLATLSRRSNLEGLALADCKLDENDFRNLGRMSKLRELRLDGVLTNVPDSTLQRAFRNLDQFRCHGGMDGDPREAERFLRTLNPTGLQSLELAKIDLTGNDIVWLGKLKVLEDLLLINCPIPDGSFTKMPNLKNLRSLKITRCKNVKELLRCLRGSTNIQKLFLSGASLDDSDVDIINGLENLRELTVWRVSNRHMRPDIVLRTQIKD
jgi:serine/threonine protein kinase/uncharacterized protein YjbI with pentapeptide repeats